MNLEVVRQVGRDHPTWLPTNLGRTCYAHTIELVRRIREAGHEAFLVCKMAGEGGYTPPGFTPRTVTGLDGKAYLISRVSHDVIFFRERGSMLLQQFDTLASANEYDRTIYRRNGDPNWSFDPNDGPQIVASAVWNEVPPSSWRPWNPPFEGSIEGAPAPGEPPIVPPPPAPTFRMPSYADLGDDAFFRAAIGVPLADDARLAGETMNDGSSVWFSRGTYRLMAAALKHALAQGPAPNPAAEIKIVREEWRAVMKANNPGVQFPPLA